MPDVALETTIAAPQAVVAPRLLTVLSTYAQRDDFALAASVGFAGATLNVPVKLTLIDPSSRTADAVGVAMAAARHEDWFPVFSGEVRAAPGGRMESAVQLNGEYRVPLGAFGALVDGTALADAAEASLRAFLQRLRDDVLEEVQRSELAIRRREG